MKDITNKEGSITYLNSGDWIENLTALEYYNGEWSIYRFDENETTKILEEETELNSTQLFDNLLQEFNLMKPGL